MSLPPQQGQQGEDRQWASYARQPTRITGAVRTKPGIWRIAWGVCLGLFLYTIISALIVVAVALALGASLTKDFKINSNGSIGAGMHTTG